MEFTEDLVFKLCKDKELMLVSCAGTFSIANECLQLPEYHRFIGCEKN